MADSTSRAESTDVVPHDAAWPVTFASLAGWIAPALADLDVTIEHVGSTAVPGLAAKPIIDIDVAVHAAVAVQPVVARLSTLGYEHEGNLGIAGREAVRPPSGLPPRYPYVVVAGSAPYLDHLLFRDYIRKHPSRRQKYGEHKRSIAHLLVTDRQAYVGAQAGLIRDILHHAHSAARSE